jgi:hypothetical protein
VKKSSERQFHPISRPRMERHSSPHVERMLVFKV